MYQYYKDAMELADGRPYKYMAKVIRMPREYVSLILRGKKKCTYEQAEKLVTRFGKIKDIEYYFKLLESED